MYEMVVDCIILVIISFLLYNKYSNDNPIIGFSY